MPDTASTVHPAQAKSPGAARLLVRGAALIAALAATMFGIVLYVPEANDYALATVLKHEQLRRSPARSIVLVGGSNLAFGMDSALIERETGCHVTNMGMNGYLGVRYMLEEVSPALKAGDVVVIALEYDNFFKTVDGAGADLLMVAKANPDAVSYLTWDQRWMVLSAMPYVAQQKILRLMRTQAFRLEDMLSGETGQAAQELDVLNIERLSGFTRHGDLTSHLGVTWPYALGDGVDATRTPVDPGVGPLLAAFNQEMTARGVSVVMSYTPVTKTYYARHGAQLEALHRDVVLKAGLNAPSPPSAYVFDDSVFFDTVYHLNAQGRQTRTERLIGDVRRQLGAHATCNARLTLSQTPGASHD
jgi:hypothetical protein